MVPRSVVKYGEDVGVGQPAIPIEVHKLQGVVQIRLMRRLPGSSAFFGKIMGTFQREIMYDVNERMSDPSGMVLTLRPQHFVNPAKPPTIAQLEQSFALTLVSYTKLAVHSQHVGW